jgi:hypothetical protein
MEIIFSEYINESSELVSLKEERNITKKDILPFFSRDISSENSNKLNEKIKKIYISKKKKEKLLTLNRWKIDRNLEWQK